MNRLALGWCLPILLLAACKDDPTPAARPTLRLERSADGTIRLQLTGGDRPVRAVEVELEGSGNDAVLIDQPEPPEGVPIDTVRVKMRGTSRAVLFAGDKRGVRLGSSGTLARFRVQTPAGGVPDARLGVVRALLVDAAGDPIEVDLGAPIPLR
jgi:hypothetical protein